MINLIICPSVEGLIFFFNMYLISPHSPNSKWKDRCKSKLFTLEFIIVYPLFSIVVLSHKTKHNPEYVSLLDLSYTIRVIHNNSGSTNNSLRNIPVEKLQTFLNLIIQNYKRQGRKCTSEELLDTFLKIKDSVSYLSSLCMSN